MSVATPMRCCHAARMADERDRFEALAAELTSWGATRDLSGTMLLTRAGERVFEVCVGAADRGSGTPVSPATRFGIASVTKMFTACAVVSLVRDGLVDFTTPVVDVLRADRRPRTLRPDVTVHHLLCHTSGIADYFEEDEDSPAYLPDYADLWRERPSYTVTRPADFLPMFGDLPPYRPPGECFQYSNAAYLVLGILLEELTGLPFTDVVQQRVFDPAGMTSSGFFRFDEPVRDVAVGYWRAGPESPWRSNIYSVPVIGGADGGAFCTARDLDTFLRAYADGTLLAPFTDLVLTRHADRGDGWGEGYGVHLYPDGRIGHGGGDPGVEALLHRWPGDDVHLAVLLNTEAGLASEVRDAMVAAWRGPA
jgi:CubicO group peptidase (beta-lactamase class C family)